MPPRKFDKKNATTFALVHRAQNDPLINDADAPNMVFAELRGPQYAKNRRKIKERGDLEDEFGTEYKPNEGEAAEHGVYFDDTQYDYMQHLRDLGSGGGAATWVEAPSAKNKNKGKMSLEDALRGMDLKDDDLQSYGGESVASSRSLMPDDMLPSDFVRKTTYQDMQNVPDAIAGFQPDMDPRLREALEALEDEAYVDGEDDFFGELTGDAEELDRDDFEDLQFDEEEGNAYVDDDDEGWQSDDTIKAGEGKGENLPPPADTAAPPPSDPSEGAWMEEFTKFKQDVKAAKALPKKPVQAAPSEIQSVNTGLSSLASGRRKKRKGAMTSTSGYSMSSSALVRTDAQSLLDQRFDKIEEAYAEDDFDDYGSQFDDAESMASGMTGMSHASAISSYSRATDSEAPNLVRTDFDSIMDGFLAGHSRAGNRGRHIKKSGFQTGMEQLDEIRFGLGPARLGKSARAQSNRHQ
ncbi:Low temperature viability protein [Aureobasidium pullulans]|nr:Low temperature viability protein [Aureobasidium pullulans]